MESYRDTSHELITERGPTNDRFSLTAPRIRQITEIKRKKFLPKQKAIQLKINSQYDQIEEEAELKDIIVNDKNIESLLSNSLVPNNYLEYSKLEECITNTDLERRIRRLILDQSNTCEIKDALDNISQIVKPECNKG